MKNMFFIAFMLFVFILLVACSIGNENKTKIKDWEPTQYDTVNNFDGISMTVKKDSISPTKLTVILENNSDNHGIYGDSFLLEKKVEGEWYQVPYNVDDYGFNAIGYELDPSVSQEFTTDWEWLYGSLDAGEYRIVKDILDFRETGDYDEYYLTTEFTID